MSEKEKRDWADDDEVDEVSQELPLPQTISNRDGTKTIITYRLNEKDQKVKVTRRVRFITHREVINPRVAERKTWPKFGASANDSPGPQPDTTSVGENIIFRPSLNWQKEQKDDSRSEEKEKLRNKKILCRICSNEHFTANCPFKDTLPVGGEGGFTDVAAGMGDDISLAAAPGAKKGAYVPPAMRGDRGAAAATGAGRFSDRDDLATLRVTNISELAEEHELRDIFERFGRVSRVFLAKDKDTNLAKGFAFISYYDRNDAVRACEKLDGFGFRHLILRVEFAKKAA